MGAQGIEPWTSRVKNTRARDGCCVASNRPIAPSLPRVDEQLKKRMGPSRAAFGAEDPGTRLAEASQAPRITKISGTSSEVHRAGPISEGGADGGAVGEVLLDFRRKSGGAAGITTAAPRNRRSMGQGG